MKAAFPLFLAVLGLGVGVSLACDYGIQSLTVSSGDQSATSTGGGTSESIELPAPANVTVTGSIPGGIVINAVATPTEAGFKPGKLMWRLRKGHEEPVEEPGEPSRTFTIKRLGRYIVDAHSQNHRKVAVIVGPKIICVGADKGRLGDEVPSKKEEGERHFVTPKKDEYLDSNFVTFTVLGMARDQFGQLCEWHCEPATSGTKNDANPKEFFVKRTEVGRVKLSVRLKAKGTELDKINVWVVWCSDSYLPTVLAPYLDVDPSATTVGGYLSVLHTIAPAEIVEATQDIPDFTGPSVTPDAAPKVPSTETGVYNAGTDLAGGGSRKWDSTRQVRIKIVNPNSVDLSPIRRPTFTTTYLNYPSGHLVGNDDSDDTTETNNPYAAPFQGSLWGWDDPSMPIMQGMGNVGDKLEFRNHFMEFARLQIAGKWYRISAPFYWKLNIKVKKVAELDPDGNPSTNDAQDLDGDGDIDTGKPGGEIWVDDSSEFSADNIGF